MSTTYDFTVGQELDYRTGFSPESKEAARLLHTVQANTSGLSTPILSHPLSPEMNRINECITKLAKLEDDWDSNDALAPTAGVVHNTRILVNHLDRAFYYAGVNWHKPHCFATPTGGIELFWQSENLYLSLLVEPEFPGQVIVLDGNGIQPSQERHLDCVTASSYATGRLCTSEVGR